MVGAGLFLLGCKTGGPSAEPAHADRALNDRRVVRRTVRIASGSGEIDAQLARPDKPGQFPIVVVVAGNSIDEEYIANTTALLAQREVVGIAPTSTRCRTPRWAQGTPIRDLHLPGAA